MLSLKYFQLINQQHNNQIILQEGAPPASPLNTHGNIGAEIGIRLGAEQDFASFNLPWAATQYDGVYVFDEGIPVSGQQLDSSR